MRKIIIFAFLTATNFILAQEETEKKFQAGLTFGTGVNLNKTATKKMAVNGVGSNLSVGVGLNYFMTNSIGAHFGLELDFENNKIRPSDVTSPSYYQFSDTKILKSDEAEGGTYFQYTNRTQKPIYLTIPTELYFRTKYFGYLRFFGKFGLRSSFLLGNKIFDEGFMFENNSLAGNKIAAENNTMKAAGDMSFLRETVGFTLGAEYNFSGSTSVFAELGYYYGFIPVYRSNKEKNQTLFYFDQTNNGQRTYYSNDMTQSQLHIKIGLLF
ncbi:MAG: PorT family protein [Bacteroidetes bacterium]|nr:PorT family protein [Bacteroidota bacterium]